MSAKQLLLMEEAAANKKNAESPNRDSRIQSTAEQSHSLLDPNNHRSLNEHVLQIQSSVKRPTNVCRSPSVDLSDFSLEEVNIVEDKDAPIDTESTAKCPEPTAADQSQGRGNTPMDCTIYSRLEWSAPSTKGRKLFRPEKEDRSSQKSLSKEDGHPTMHLVKDERLEKRQNSRNGMPETVHKCQEVSSGVFQRRQEKHEHDQQKLASVQQIFVSDRKGSPQRQTENEHTDAESRSDLDTDLIVADVDENFDDLEDQVLTVVDETGQNSPVMTQQCTPQHPLDSRLLHTSSPSDREVHSVQETKKTLKRPESRFLDLIKSAMTKRQKLNEPCELKPLLELMKRHLIRDYSMENRRISLPELHANVVRSEGYEQTSVKVLITGV